ncbi:Nif3-like dinuclear metal center hexameric protein [Longirhabdus pacifica]|uniref:Nif3-like dinuclear metal center hexameric protein n=1 Tax=Longirhabdus pacifica TaxID=2305227 RepID=UPI001008BA48|nr:Nif3-like dinuclear metal center hexameric protein [Longirhabdus pacifica]
MFAKGATIAQWIEQFAPKSLAVPNDPIGLQIGSFQKEVKKVLVTLDVTEKVVDEAIAMGVNFIFAHHAVMFRPMKHIQTDTPSGSLVEKCMKHDIAIYIAHTNLDIANGGINDMLADALSLQHVGILHTTFTESIYKLAVFVPEENKEEVFNAVCHAGAGSIGDYSHCTFQSAGLGTFSPLAGSQPYIGKQGKLETVSEVKLETVVPESKLKKVLHAMKKAHPYEEVAYDLYVLNVEGKAYGLGRVGKLEQPLKLADFVQMVKQQFDVPMLRVVGNMEQQVQKIGVLGGSGAKYMSDAIFKGCDAYITGDIDFHTAQDALAAGLILIDPGHHIEKIMIQQMAAYLEERLLEHKSNTKVVGTAQNTEPFQFV